MIMLGAIYYNFVMILFWIMKLNFNRYIKTLNYITTHFDKFEHIYRISKIRRLNFSSFIRFNIIITIEKLHLNINHTLYHLTNRMPAFRIFYYRFEQIRNQFIFFL